MSIALYDHNLKAYEAVCSMFTHTQKACVVHPTGTGKSFIAFKLCEDNPDKRICWLSPSEYIYKTQLENLRKVMEVSVTIHDNLDMAGATDVSKKLKSLIKNITFCTYARLACMTEDEIRALVPDYIILDEFHRCGAEVWGQGVEKLLGIYAQAKVLGLSATAVRYLDNQRDMSDELFDGNIASTMTLGEAVVRGILPAPKYVMSVYSYQESLAHIETRIGKIRNVKVKTKAEEYLEKLRRALTQADGLTEIFAKHMTDKTGKYIVFCSDYDAMTEAVKMSGEWFSKIDKTPNIYTFYSEDPDSKKSFAAFKEDTDRDHLKLLFCIDALNEGIHVENIAGVILMRPTVSPIVYKQQIGRALSTSGSGIPVILDIVNNIENLYSIDSIREEMQETVRYFRYVGETEKIVNESFRIVDEVKDCIELFDRLEGLLIVSWEEMYKKAVKYSKEHGNLNINYDYETEEGLALGRWLSVQRANYRKNDGSINPDRIKKLSFIGMDWQTVEERAWDRAVNALKDYRERYGNVDVPASYVSDKGMDLSRWLRSVRQKYNEGLLKPDQIEMLEGLGVTWNTILDQRWRVCYEKAIRYYAENGDLNVPKYYVTEDGVKLGTWITSQRVSYIKGTLGKPKERLLDSINMSWNMYENKWERGYECARRYVEKNGDINSVPDDYVYDGIKLKTWINTQRCKLSDGKLTDERKMRLSELGIVWKQFAAQWDIGYRHALEYAQKYGNLKVPVKYECQDGFKLKYWLNNQITKYKNGKLSESQVCQLEGIGMSLGRGEK